MPIFAAMKRICAFITRWMALIVLAAAVLSFLLPSAMSHVRTSWVPLLLGLVMFGMGLTLTPKDFALVFSHPRDVLIGFVCQFTIMPLLALVLAKVFSLPPELAVGVILVGCCPGGTSSNVITYLSRGNVALSVAMTGVSTLLAPVMTPLLVRRFLPKAADSVSGYLPAFSTIVITLIVIAVVSANAQSLHRCGLLVIAVVILHNVAGYLLGYLAGKLLRLNPDSRIAVSVEVGMQNSGLACSLAATNFASMAMAPVPGAVFSVWHNISGALFAAMRQKRLAGQIR